MYGREGIAFAKYCQLDDVKCEHLGEKADSVSSLFSGALASIKGAV
jgi:hypothetical protein